MNELLLRLMQYGPVGRFFFNNLKKRLMRPFQIPLDKTIEKQDELLRRKFERMKGAGIGKRLGVGRGVKLESIPITDYDFYDPFFNNPSPGSLMYPIESYERIKTSGTGGKEKWFMLPKSFVLKSIFETALPNFIITTHDGDRITLEYGDTLYFNTAPRPFASGVMTSTASGNSGKNPLFDIVPNMNLSFKDKTNFFINNCDKVDLAVIQASIMISRIVPELSRSINLKGLCCPDTSIAEVYFDEIYEFAGVPPRTSYNSTETLGFSIPSIQHRLGYFLDWRNGIVEFIPLKDGVAVEDEILRIDEVEVGRVYKVIYTGLESDITRYDTLNSFECLANGDDILGIDHPIFKFHSRLEKTIALHNFTRLGEDEIKKTLGDCGVQFVEFTARKVVDGGLEYLQIYIETEDHMTNEDMTGCVHKRLYDDDADYRDLVDFYGYVPTRIVRLPLGTFSEYLDTKIATIAKVDRVEMKDEELKKLLKSIKGQKE